MDYQNRGKWGNSSYRGNCSGHVIKDLLSHFKPKQFLEVFAGSGTGLEVAKELGYINSIHLDLRPEFGSWNALKDEIPSGSDFVFSHPAYHDIIKYSGSQWGTEGHPDDLSRCPSYEDFIAKLNIVNAKIYASLQNGGRHATLIGDVRKKGHYYSIMKDMAFIGDLESHIIKTQHNTVSGRKQYNGNFIPILHEHLLIFKKNQVWNVSVKVTKTYLQDLKTSLQPTWRDLVQAAVEELGGRASLKEIYQALEGAEKSKQNQHWKEKVRQVLQLHQNFYSQERGTWELNAA